MEKHHSLHKMLTYILIGEISDERRNDKSRKTANGVHDTIKRAGKVRRKILMIDQAGLASSTVEGKREDHHSYSECRVAASVCHSK